MNPINVKTSTHLRTLALMIDKAEENPGTNIPDFLFLHLGEEGEVISAMNTNVYGDLYMVGVLEQTKLELLYGEDNV